MISLFLAHRATKNSAAAKNFLTKNMMFETGWPQENISNLTFKVLISANARFLRIKLVNH